ncbi:MAG: hypothetical protein ACKO3W_11415 [bacterium]
MHCPFYAHRTPATLHAPRRVCRAAVDGVRRWLVAWAVLFSILAPMVGSTRAARADMQVLSARPPAVRGEPLLVPVRFDGAVPRSIDVLIEVPRTDGRVDRAPRLSAAIVWPVRVREATTGRWASSASPLVLEASRPSGATDAYIAIELPEEIPAKASLAIGASTIEPVWHDRAPNDLLLRLAERASMLVPQGAPDALLSRPDPSLPFERFRFAIGRALRGWDEPATAAPLDSSNALAARASTALWMAALARIASVSEGTAAEAAELLVATASDPQASAPIAAWIADSAEVSALLTLALDPARSDEAMVDAVVTWLRVRTPLLIWVEEETRDDVAIAMVNPTSGEEVVRLEWIERDLLSDSDPPVATIVPPTETVRLRLPRARGAEIDGAEIPDGGPEVLRIENRGIVRSLSIAPASVRARPSGIEFAPFVAPLDLPTVAAGARAPDLLAPPMVASLRPRLEGWEILVESRGAMAGARVNASEGGETSSTDVRTADLGVAADRVELVGRDGRLVRVFRDGRIEDPDGVLADGPGVAVREFGDRWRLALLVPPAWLNRVGAATLVEVGFRRRIGTSVFDAPRAAPPWRPVPRTIAVDILPVD